MKNILTLAVLLLIVALLATACGGSKEEMITFNQKISGEIGAGDTKTYSFEGEEGMYIFLEQLESAEWTTFNITTPDELEQISERGLGDGGNRVTVGAIQLRETGVYILDIDQSDDLPTDYAFVIWHVDPPEIVGGTIEFNKLNSGQAAIPGQKVTYTFESMAGQQIFLEQRNSDMWTSFTVIGQDGLEVFSERGLGSGGNRVVTEVTLMQGGIYTLTVDHRDANRGSVEFIVTTDAALDEDVDEEEAEEEEEEADDDEDEENGNDNV